MPSFNAAVLAGGRSSRLGGVPKSSLILAGSSLLDITCAAVSGARRTVVVGPEPGPERSAGPLTDYVRESPPFGGPAAAVAAAVGHFNSTAEPWLLVVACDMPRVAVAVRHLLEAVSQDPSVSVLAHDGGRDQPLAALYRSSELASAVEAANASGGVANISMRSLLATVQWRAVQVPRGSTTDVDTWDDAQSLGVVISGLDR